MRSVDYIIICRVDFQHPTVYREIRLQSPPGSYHRNRIQAQLGSTLNCNLFPFTPLSYSPRLYSQIVRINGSSTTDDSVVIIGAHQDRCVLIKHIAITNIQWIHFVPFVAQTCGHSCQPQVTCFNLVTKLPLTCDFKVLMMMALGPPRSSSPTELY
jgi:hypothetical protein